MPSIRLSGKCWTKLAGAVDFDLKALCFTGPEETLCQTQYTQPCMVAFAAGRWPSSGGGPAAGRRRWAQPGGILRLMCCGVFTPRQAVQTAAFRGRAMTQASQGQPSAMAAILGLDRESLAQACEKAQGLVEIANYNCPGQMAIAGDEAAVQAACQYAKEAGAKRCVPLKVSGPFHTSRMAPAAQALHRYFLGHDLRGHGLPGVLQLSGQTHGAGRYHPSSAGAAGPQQRVHGRYPAQYDRRRH